MKSLKFNISLLLLLLLGKGFLFSQNLMHYTSSQYGYSLMLPEDWKRSDEIKSEQVALVIVSENGASLSVSFYELNGISSDQFKDRYEKSLENNFQDLALQEKGMIKARDDEANYLVYDYAKNGEVKREKDCFYSRPGEMIVISATSLKSNFHESIPIFDEIFKSFTFETDWEKVDSDD